MQTKLLSELHTELDKLKRERKYTVEETYPISEESIRPELEPEPNPPVYAKPKVPIFYNTKKINIIFGVILLLFCLPGGFAMGLIMAPVYAMILAIPYGIALYHNYQVNVSRYQVSGEYTSYKARLDAEYETELASVRSRNAAKLAEYESVKAEFDAAYNSWANNRDMKVKEYDQDISDIENAIKAILASEVN